MINRTPWLSAGTTNSRHVLLIKEDEHAGPQRR
jgi:hypothetical protein